jgi:hypothetical protein
MKNVINYFYKFSQIVSEKLIQSLTKDKIMMTAQSV